MQNNIQKITEIWHKHFQDPQTHYSEFESSDIEYFVGCMLYNHFAFSKALQNLKTMDLSYDFLTSCAHSYDEVKEGIESIQFENEEDALAFLQKYIQESRDKYTKDQLYLLDRLKYHVDAMATRYKSDVDVEHIDFENPLLRK